MKRDQIQTTRSIKSVVGFPIFNRETNSVAGVLVVSSVAAMAESHLGDYQTMEVFRQLADLIGKLIFEERQKSN